MFLFQFINSFASLYYLAFIAQNLSKSPNTPSNYEGQCGSTSCMEPLAVNLVIILFSRIFVKNAFDVLIPYFYYVYTIAKETAGIDENRILTPPERDYMLMQYDATLDNVYKYTDTCIQFGYMTLFVGALPVAPLLTLVYNYVYVKGLAWRLVTLHKRPYPAGAQSIESWQTIFTIMSIIAAMTNAGMVSFTMHTLYQYDYAFRIWVFVGFQWLMLLIYYLTEMIIPQEPEQVQIQKDRIEAISQKIINKYEDDDYDELTNPDKEDSAGKRLSTGRGSNKRPAPARDVSLGSLGSNKSNTTSNSNEDSGTQTGHIHERTMFERFLCILTCNFCGTASDNATGFTSMNMSHHQSELHEQLPPVKVLRYPFGEKSRNWQAPLHKLNFGEHGEMVDANLFNV